MASGIADYSFELLGLVAEAAEVDVVCPRPGRLRRPKAPSSVSVVPPERFRPDRYDAIYYHLANNPWHEFVYEASLRHPGICVFHDVVLHHLIVFAMFEGSDQAQRYTRLMAADHGELGARLARLRILGVTTELEKFLFPLARHVVRAAAALVVHSADSQERLRAIAGDVDREIEVIPHHAGTPPPDVAGIDRSQARRRLRLSADAFLVGHPGFLTLPKQPGTVVEGFARFRGDHPTARLVVVGADKTGGAFERAVRQHGIQGAVDHVGYVDLSDFYLYLKAFDVVVVLRYPTAGESSGTFARALAEGRATIVNNYGSFAEVPDDVALKLELDGDQTAELAGHLRALARDSELRLRLERNAREYARTVLDPRRCAQLYASFARRVAAGPAGVAG
jgi:glycosyltransferase involved in cell wall biosynthesis